MGFWKNLFGVGNESQGYILGDSEGNVERLFGFDGQSKAIRYGQNVYTPDGRYLGNNMPSPKMPSTPSINNSGGGNFSAQHQAQFNSPLVQRMREFTERKMREG